MGESIDMQVPLYKTLTKSTGNDYHSELFSLFNGKLNIIAIFAQF